MPTHEIAHLIHYYRKQSGLSQQELARLAGVGKQLSMILKKGKNRYG